MQTISTLSNSFSLSDFDDETHHALGYHLAIRAISESESADPKKHAMLLLSQIAEIAEGFRDALECYAFPEIYGPPQTPYVFAAPPETLQNRKTRSKL